MTVDLAEKPAFPLGKHIEQKDVASGAIQFAQLFEAGDKLFHTPYNGLDGVGMKVAGEGEACGAPSVEHCETPEVTQPLLNGAFSDPYPLLRER